MTPDDPAPEEVPEVPVVEAVADPAPEPEVAAADLVDPPNDPAPPEPPPPPSPLPRWMQERLGEETTKRQHAEQAARVAIERANSLEEITRRLQAAGTPPPADPARPPEPPRPAEPTRPAAPAGVDPAAVALAEQQIMLRNINTAGEKEYGPKWGDAVNALNAFDANTVEFVMAVAEVDPARAHEIMFNIAQDGERAISLVRMSPIKRIAEITRMTMAQPAPKDAAKPAEPPKPAPVSRAPAPKPAIAPHAASPEVDPRTPEGNEKMSAAQWNEWYAKTYLKRA